MSHTGSLHTLVRVDPLTKTDWFYLLEQRRVLLVPYLHEMTLKSLGDLKIVREERHGYASERPLRMGAMVEKTYRDPPYRKYREEAKLTSVEGDFSLDTRGIFPDDEVYYRGHFKRGRVPESNRVATDSSTRFWGLTRDNQWIKAESIERSFTQARYAGHDEREDRRSEVVKLVVSASTPQEICQFCDITPQWIWQRLGDAAEAWLKHRQDLLARAEKLTNIISHEKLMVDVIAKK